METRQSVRWVHESGPVGQLGSGAFTVGTAAIAGAWWLYTVVGRYVGRPDATRQAAAMAVMGLIMAALCVWRLRRPHYVHTEVAVGPEGIWAKATRHAKPASETDRDSGRTVRDQVVPWERVRSIVVQSNICGAQTQHLMRIQIRLRVGGGETGAPIPDAETADQAMEVAREHLPAKAIRTFRVVWPTARQSWWLAGLSLVWVAIAFWIMAHMGYRPNFESLWLLVVVFGYGPGMPWALAITKGRGWRSPMSLMIAALANAAANSAAAMVLMVIQIVTGIR